MEHVEKLAYSVPELAGVLGIGRSSAYELIKTEGFPVISIGRRIIIPVAQLETWLYKQSQSCGEVAG